jgi:ribosomal protein L37AE/L43A
VGTVIDIRTKLPVPEFSVTVPQTQEDVAQSKGAQWVCLRCNTEEFKLYTDGMIKCADCGAHLNNITVNFKEKGAA